MTDYELKNIASEDIGDLLRKVETSFDIKFVDNELAHITTFGQLCVHITNKIHLHNSDDCTSQQAFYKLRAAMSTTLQIDSGVITPDFPITEILPGRTRRLRIKKLEKQLGFQLNILRPPHWATSTLAILCLASILALFFNLKIGIFGLVFSIAGFWFANKVGNELDLQTVGQLTQKMTRENYLKSRRNPQTFNKKEIEKVLTDWFSTYLDLDKSKLTRDATFV